MNAPRAALIPARSVEPYPRCSTRTTRAPRFSATSIDPSVDPLSATTTSPRSSAARNVSIAFETQIPMEFASFKHGITTDTSTPPCASCTKGAAFFAVNASPSSAFTPPSRISHFQLAFSPVPIIMAKFRKVPETLQLPNPSDLSSIPSASASSGTFDARSEPRSRGRLLKVLGMWFGISAAVGNTIAAGIVRAPGDIARWLPNIYLFFGVWVVGGLYALSGASSMAELGAAIPRSGGQYNFSRRALGEYSSFIVGCSDWLSTCGTAAAVAIVIPEHTGELIRPLNGHVNLIAVLIIFGFFVLQWRGIKWGSGTQLVTAALKTFAFVIVVAACFLFGRHARVAASVSAPPTLLFANAVRHELRRLIFPQLYARECRRHSYALAFAKHHRRRALRVGFYTQAGGAESLRVGHRHAFIFFCCQLHAVLFFALRAAQERTTNGAPLSRLGLSVGNGHRTVCVRAFSDRVHRARPENGFDHWPGLAAKPRDACSVHSPSQLSYVSAVAMGDSPQRKPSVTDARWPG